MYSAELMKDGNCLISWIEQYFNPNKRKTRREPVLNNLSYIEEYKVMLAETNVEIFRIINSAYPTMYIMIAGIYRISFNLCKKGQDRFVTLTVIAKDLRCNLDAYYYVLLEAPFCRTNFKKAIKEMLSYIIEKPEE